MRLMWIGMEEHVQGDVVVYVVFSIKGKPIHSEIIRAFFLGNSMVGRRKKYKTVKKKYEQQALQKLTKSSFSGSHQFWHVELWNRLLDKISVAKFQLNRWGALHS